ncbi:hypothetical protein [Halodurantibacterium flavum]|uniref:YubB ferredoxin-like domain-containing protein n=1 Tax=Halodurantibacterium flavum TaxID=1382802 RepID=A0ABW4S2H9_9RHOB
MPNHVTNRVTVTGPSPAIAAFRRAFFVETVETDKDGGEDRVADFDFTRVIPRPKVLEETKSSSAVITGLIVLGRPEILKDGFGGGSLEQEVARYLACPWVQEAGVTDSEGLKSLLTERDPSCVAKAEVAIRAYEECGHASWYSWALCNWGTKWNSYSLDFIEEGAEVFDFRFDTAWSPPEPVFAALAERPECADLEIEIRRFDEGWNFAYRARIADGCFSSEDVEPTPEIYEEVYGETCLDVADEDADDTTGPAMI